MTATQIIVLALLVAAFAAGWIGRGAGRRDDARFTSTVEDGLEALEQAQHACDSALRRRAGADLDGVTSRLREVRRELAEWVGAESPLVEDVEAARDALTLIAGLLRDGAPAAASPLANVVRDARVRYGRAARTIELLPE